MIEMPIINKRFREYPKKNAFLGSEGIANVAAIKTNPSMIDAIKMNFNSLYLLLFLISDCGNVIRYPIMLLMSLISLI